MKKVSITINLDKNLLEKIDKFAEEENRSRSNYINAHMKAHLKDKKSIYLKGQ